MTSTAPLARRTATVDSWTLRAMREAKAHRDEIGEPDAYWDARLAAAEAGRVVPATEQADEEPRRGGGGSGMSNYGKQAAAGASDAQARFITSLARDLGWTEHATQVAIGACKDRAGASRLIDAMKAEVAQQRRAGAAPAGRVERMATERQVEFLASLLNERQHDLGEIDPTTVTAARASDLIERLMASPRALVAAHGIREGRYAFAIAEGEARFYRVTRTGQIRVQAGPSEHPYRGKLNADLEWIKANPREAAALYGQLIGRCGRCGLELTDDTSRELGLGPVCAKKGEW